ncbi:hypothetical protein GX563_12820 [Candidatus Bathyarchaeota archaeon]|nr:hypothetical protein [Candidatus Bathyarchaeota archaeon]
MKKSLSIVLIAVLALGFGIAYAAPMLIVPNSQLYPQVIEGPKAKFSIEVVYAEFNQTTNANIYYDVVLNVTNTADTPTTLYDITFAAAQEVTVHDSILGGTIYDNGRAGAFKHFGGVVNGVYLDGDWVNTTWIPNFYDEINGTQTIVPYPLCLYRITQASLYSGISSGPLTPDNVAAYSADHSINGTIPELPANANDAGIWFEGVPIAEYYDSEGNPLVTMMYINGAWVDVTGKVTVDHTKPMITASNMLVNQVLSLGEQPYHNMNSTVGPVVALPTWGDWGVGGSYYWFPWDWASQPFNSTFAPHESRLIRLNNVQQPGSLAALESGSITLYASASNYIINRPINGTFLNTVSTTTQIKQLQLQQTSGGYLYNAILADNQVFQQGNSRLEVNVVPRTEP